MATIRDMVIDGLEYYGGCKVEDVLHLESEADRSCWYASIRNEDEVYACVVLVDLDGLSPTRVKVVHENSGPYAFGPSKKLLDLLTPTDDETALLWRQACRVIESGQSIIGSPYQAFSDSFLDPSGNITSFTANTERAAYRMGIEDCFNGVLMGDKDDDPLVSQHYMQWFDGWFWANNQIQIAELEKEAEEAMSSKCEDEEGPPTF